MINFQKYKKNIKTNNGLYNLILSQPKKELSEFRKKLVKTNYYSNWDEDYLKEILQEDYYLIERDSNPAKSSDLVNQEQINDQKGG